MNVPLLDLQAQYATIKNEIMEVLQKVCESQRFIKGPDMVELEKEIARYCSCSHAVGCASGSDALLLALMHCKVGPGDEVITTPFTFFATAGSIARLGAKPVFVDVLPDSYNLNPALLEKAITPRTKAFMPVHLFGQCADMDPMLEICKRKNIPVVEDAAQSIGAEYKGRRACSMGAYGCLSFFPSKNLGAFGDGGMITVNNDQMADDLCVLREHGSKPKYYHKLIGLNSRLDSLQAAVLRVKLKHLDNWSNGRRKNADLYRKLFKDLNLADKVGLPVESKDCRHIYNQFVIRVPKRDALLNYLKEQQIGAEIYYPVPLHLQECFRYLGYKDGDFPVSEKAAKEVLALPIYTELTEQQQSYVVEKIAEFVKKNL